MTLVKFQIPVTKCSTEIIEAEVLVTGKDTLKEFLEKHQESNLFEDIGTFIKKDSRPDFSINHIEDVKIIKEKCIG